MFDIYRAIRLGAAALALLVSPASVHASSEEAWDEFRAQVEEACLSAADGILEEPRIVVDPFGSERFGLAVLTGREAGGDDAERMVICVFDKTERTAELGTPLDREP